MAKIIPIALQQHYDGGGTTTAYALVITRGSGHIFGFTSHDESQVVDGVFCDASQGLDVSGLASSASLAVNNLELTTLDDGSVFERAEVLAGVWQDARFRLLRYNWAAPGDGVEYLMAGTLGEVRLVQGALVCELRGLEQYLQQPVGNVTSKTCRARFADYPSPSTGNRCRLIAAEWQDAVTVAASASRRAFTVVSSPRDAGWFDEGVVDWLSGANIGLRSHIKLFGSDLSFELYQALPHAIAPGDTALILAGCRKRRQEDCLQRFDNVLNFQGEPDLPGVDALTSPPGGPA